MAITNLITELILENGSVAKAYVITNNEYTYLYSQKKLNTCMKNVIMWKCTVTDGVSLGKKHCPRKWLES